MMNISTNLKTTKTKKAACQKAWILLLLFALIFSPEGWTQSQSCTLADFGPGDNIDDERLVWMNYDTGIKQYTATASGISFVENDDGTASITGTVYRVDDNNYQWNISVSLVAKRNWSQWSSISGRTYKANDFVNGEDHTTWIYYEVDNANSFFYGAGSHAGKTLNIAHNPSDFEYGFQYGIGANAKDFDFGLSGWFLFSGSENGHGDFNGDMQNCQNNPSYSVVEVELGSDLEICPGETVTINSEVTNENTCTEACTLTGEQLIVSWDMEDCASFSNDGSYADYSEFTNPAQNNANCATVSINGLYRYAGTHSCTDDANNDDPGDAVCFSMPNIYSFENNHENAIRFDIAIDPDNGFSGITKLEFKEMAPQQYLWSQTGNTDNTGQNNYPTKYGVRVLKDGVEVYKQINIDTEQNWNLETFDFSSNPNFASSVPATYTFELLAYAPIGNGSPAYAWDIDDLKVYAGCCTPTTTQSLTYNWSNGQTTSSIQVTETGNYSLTVTDCAGITATDEIIVSIKDEDNDGVCDDTDCAPSDPFYPNTPGVSCDDNNANTIFDVVQNDGCSCAGSPTPSISINDVTVNEEDGNAILEVCIDQPVTFPVTVDYFTSAGSALEVVDYVAAMGFAQISAGETCVEIFIPIVDDEEPEDVETFTVELNNPTNSTISDPSGTVTILDTDVIVPGVGINDVTVNEEDGNATLEICIDQPTTVSVSVDYSTSNGSAIEGSDYEATQGTVTIPAGETCVEIQVPIVDDENPENTEGLFVLLSNPSNTTIADPSGTVTILDTDVVVPGVGINDVTVNEEDGNATLEICIDQPTTVPVSVDYSTSDGSALEGSDYEATQGTVTIPAGETCVEIQVPIVDDENPENTEGLFVLLSNPSNTTIADPSGTVTILDTDVIVPGVGINDVTVNEEDGNATLEICIDQPTTVPVTVDYSTSDGSALEGSDYQVTQGTVTIPAGETCVEIQVPIVDDENPENTEGLFVLLSNPSNTTIADPSGTITILDTDVIVPGVGINDITVNEEDGNATLEICIDQPTTVPVSVEYTTSDGSALEGSDYEATQGTITIPAGETCVEIQVPIVDDENPENTEGLFVLLSNPSNTTIADPSGTVTILDTDVIVPGVGINDVTVNEEDGNATLEICIDQPTTVPVSVDYSTSDGSALEGSDFQVTQGTVTIPAGETCVEIQVPIVDDENPENTEGLFVLLSNPSNTTIADPSGTITILDTDVIVPSVGINDVTVNEEDGNATLEICIDQPTSVPVSIDYSTSDGSALEVSDYQVTQGTVTIPAGETCVEIQVPIIDDENPENTEGLFVLLSNPSNTTIADPSGTVTILDTDVIVPGVGINDVTVNEEDGNATLEICIDQPTTVPVSVEYTTSDGSAIEGSDYQITQGTVTIPAGETCVEIQVPIVDDENPENTEGLFVLLSNPSNTTIADPSGTVTILDTDPECDLLQISATVSDLTCDGFTNGSIEILVTGGTGSYNYQWSNGSSSQNIYDLVAGNYTVTVEDDNGCAVFETFTVSSSEPIITEGTVTDVSCNGGQNGAIELNVNGGTAPYTFLWSNGETSQNLDNLEAGIYSVTVDDVNLCKGLMQFTVSEPTILALSTIETAISCDGATDGAIDLSISGGTPPYSINWSNGVSTEDIQGLGAGTYTAVVTDANTCSATISSTLSEPNLTTSFETQDILCPGAPIDFTAENEGPGATYQWYFWNGPTTNSTYLGAAEGAMVNYSYNSGGQKLVRLVVTTAAGCELEYNEVITVLSANDPACTTCENVSNGGLIENNEEGCAPMTPEEIVNAQLPEGGSGDLEYLWMKSNQSTAPQNINDPNWTIIAGADQMNHSPAVIETTTYYIRLSKRAGCDDWMQGASNIVAKEILGDAINPEIISDTELCVGVLNDFIVESVGPGATYQWYFFNGSTPNSTYLGSREGIEVDFMFTSPGEKFVRLFVETPYGCSATVDLVVTLLEEGTPNCPENIIQEQFELNLTLLENDEVRLDWSTTNEGLNVIYEIQHSTDGINYEIIGTKDGLSTETADYKYIDDAPMFGINYYRIKQYRLSSGSYLFSNIREVEIRFDDNNSSTIYPNPVLNQATLFLAEPFIADATIEITSATGKNMDTIIVPAGETKVIIDMSSYNGGFYFIYTNEKGFRTLINKVLKVSY